MNISQILECEEIRCIEPSFADLIEDIYTNILLSFDARDGRLLIDEYEHPIALALYNGLSWTVANFLFRQPTIRVLELFEKLSGDIYQESRENWISAVRAYYSKEILTNVVPAVEDVSQDRFDILCGVIENEWGRVSRDVCIECCCGSGIGSFVLRSMEMFPIAYDNDPSLLALGLMRGRLQPDETMWIDGARASIYCSHAPKGVCFMLGEIYNFNVDMWHQIVDELIKLADDSIITVGTENEATLIQQWVKKQGCECNITENYTDPIYDHWVCHIIRK